MKRVEGTTEGSGKEVKRSESEKGRGIIICEKDRKERKKRALRAR